ncbi:MAG: hypothetical protein O2854_07210 [Chloroflexi bacterium]|nr:hypothetical protein [Chloroflexota bacterium]
MQNRPQPPLGLFLVAHILAWVGFFITVFLVVTQVDTFTLDAIFLLFIPSLLSGLGLFSAYAHKKWATKIGITIWVAAVTLTFYTILGSFESYVFLFYLPSMVTLVAAAYFRERRLQTPRAKEPRESWD